jgi:hypothetical protein
MLRDNVLGVTQLRHTKFFEEMRASCRQRFRPFFLMFWPLRELRRNFAQAAQAE